MNKKVSILFVIVALIIGGAIGFGGGKYYFIDRPDKMAMQEAEKQQRELDSMVRHGNVIEVKPTELTLNVTSSGDKEKEGKTLTVTIDNDTNIQKGSELLPYPVNLTQHIEPGAEIDVLEKDNKALAIYWESDETIVVTKTPETSDVQQVNESQADNSVVNEKFSN